MTRATCRLDCKKISAIEIFDDRISQKFFKTLNNQIQYPVECASELTGDTLVAELNVDNTSAIKMMEQAQNMKRTKHIDVRFKFICDVVKKGNCS